MDKVLVLTETIGGSGHFQAARAIRRGLNRSESDLDVEIACGLPFFSRNLEGMVRKVYLNTIQYAPGLWGAAYSKEREFSETFRSSLSRMLAGKMRELLDRKRPRVVVSTHAFCLGAIAEAKERAVQPFQLGAAITDFDVNGFWVHPAVDFYLVAHEYVAAKLKNHYGVPDRQIYRTGIPIDPTFADPAPEPEVFRRRVGISPDAFTVLLMGGGVGLGPIEQAIMQFSKDMCDAHLVVVTGKNRELLERLKSRFQTERQVHLFGYINGMRDLMKSSDLIVTKPGGLTSSEALASGLPMLICQPIPGQEERNSRFLTEHRVALRQDQPEEIPRYIRSFVQSPQRWETMRERVSQLGRPRSALDAADVIAEHIQ